MSTQAPQFRKHMPSGIISGEIEGLPSGIRYMQNGWYYGPKFNPICAVPAEDVAAEPDQAEPETVASMAAKAQRAADEAILAAKLAADEAKRMAAEAQRLARAAAAADDGAVDAAEAARTEPLPSDDDLDGEIADASTVPYEDRPWRELRDLVKANGGEYTNQVEAIEFLNQVAPLQAE